MESLTDDEVMRAGYEAFRNALFDAAEHEGRLAQRLVNMRFLPYGSEERRPRADKVAEALNVPRADVDAALLQS